MDEGRRYVEDLVSRLTGDGSRQRLTINVINVTNEKINDLS